jgi:two-component system chemotaxis response regulator CheB
MADRARVLIVDDSRIFRAALEQALAGQDGIEVAGSVWSGAKALEFVQATPPDLVTLDVEMPGLNGLEVLRAIQRLNAARPEAPPVGVIMVSAFTREGAAVTIEALEAGAFDFVTKPAGPSPEANLDALRQQLAVKVRHFLAGRKPPAAPAGRAQPPPAAHPRPARLVRMVLIAVSTGGPRALGTLLPDLCARVELPVLVVQHMPPPFTLSLAESLDRKCRHTVIEARDGEVVQPRTVYLAPGGKHLLLRGGAGGSALTALNEQPPENGCRPSADVLFRSAAAVVGGAAVALVLTGMGCDGSQGLGPLKRAGAHVIAQDEASSVVWGMPGSAVATGYVDEVLPLEQIPAAVAALVAPARSS